MATDPYEGVPIGSTGLGRRAALVTRSDSEDMPRTARLRVYAPATLTSPGTVKFIPVDNATADFVTFTVIPGTVSVIEVIARRVYDAGTTPELVIHAV